MSLKYFGKHLSISHGLDAVISNTLELNGTAFQLFLRNPQSTKFTPTNPSRLKSFPSFKSTINENGLKCVIHSPYVLNFCDPAAIEYSAKILVADLSDGNKMGAIGCVIHLGKNVERLGLSFNEAINNFVDGIVECLERTEEMDIPIIIETGAGQGTEVGWKLKNLGKIYKLIKNKIPNKIYRIKFCIDTCHIFSAGYDLINDLASIDKKIEKYLGWDNVVCVHVNDSKTCCKSFVDRHADPDHGFIGKEALTEFIRCCNKRNPEIIYILETPCEDVDAVTQMNWLANLI